MPAQRTHVDRLLRAAEAELEAPTRRQLLRIGGVAMASAAVLAACGDDSEEQGGTTRTDDEDEVPEEDSAGLDIVLANTALSLEVLLVDTYQVLLESELVTSARVIDAAGRFQSHHAEHREALIAIVEAAGAEPFTTANPVVKAALVDPMVFAASGQADLVRLAFDLEQAAAQTYVHAATALSTSDLRAAAGSIAGVEARHAAILDLIGELDSDQLAAYPPDNPLPEDALVTG